jgi:predicted alpha/beta-fold hydrolase
MQPRDPNNTVRGSVAEDLNAGAAKDSGIRPPNDHFGEPFTPRRPFVGGHAQTLVGNFLPRRNEMPAPDERLIQVETEVRLLCHCHWQPDRSRATTAIIVHGLEGSTESQYVIGTGSKAWHAGMNVVRMNMRNCGGTESLGPTLYNSSMSHDVGAVAETLVREEGLQRIALVGFSMGGNLVLKLLGEWGATAPKQIIAGVGVSPAMDLAASADALHEPANRVYEWKFLRGLRNRIKRKAALFPGLYDTRYLRGIRTLREFDDQITARYCGFQDATDYYARAASSQFLDRIAVPTLILHAEDDPFIRVLPETRRKLTNNPKVTYLETLHGGHCAFLAEADGYDGRWAERQTIAFLQRVEQGLPVSAPAWATR